MPIEWAGSRKGLNLDFDLGWICGQQIEAIQDDIGEREFTEPAVVFRTRAGGIHGDVVHGSDDDGFCISEECFWRACGQGGADEQSELRPGKRTRGPDLSHGTSVYPGYEGTGCQGRFGVEGRPDKAETRGR